MGRPGTVFVSENEGNLSEHILTVSVYRDRCGRTSVGCDYLSARASRRPSYHHQFWRFGLHMAGAYQNIDNSLTTTSITPNSGAPSTVDRSGQLILHISASDAPREYQILTRSRRLSLVCASMASRTSTSWRRLCKVQ
jgi:hypothetical protein